MIFKKDFEIELSDINIHKQTTNKAILKCLENIAENHSNSIKLGVNNIHETGITWVLLDWKLEILKRPSYGDILHINTWSSLNKKVYAYRDFEIYVNNEKYARATSKWALIDIYTNKILKIEEDFMQKYNPENNKFAFEDIELEKLKDPQNYDLEKIVAIRKSDIDVNGHLHNLNYIDLAREALSEQEDEEYTNLRITYKKEIKYGDSVKVCKKKQDNKISCIIKSSDNTSIHAILEMSKRGRSLK